MLNLSTSQVSNFQEKIYSFYKTNKRDFPWRDDATPYEILVSEFMLQQTQTARVVEKYTAFLRVFPTIQLLADASLPEVVSLWQGLGYNRRAKFLHNTAIEIVNRYGGSVPSNHEDLESLPGIGPYTASALLAFIHHQPTTVIETNIRTVYIDHFFEDETTNIDDKNILHLIAQTVDNNDPKNWYYALMDYGAFLKQNGVKNNAKSRHYSKQSKFEGSDRQVRGQLIKDLAKNEQIDASSIFEQYSFDDAQIKRAVQSLIKDELVVLTDGTYKIKDK